MKPLKIFIGYDPRQAVAFHTLAQSIMANTSAPVAITPLQIETLPITREGLTPFTYSRFLVPWLCDYEGWALFLDADMVVHGDVSKMLEHAFASINMAIFVPDTKDAFERASVMLFNCGHPENRILTPELVQNPESGKNLHTVKWVDKHLIGTIPAEWSHIVGRDQPRKDPKLVHYTMGIPGYPECDGCEHADLWKEYRDQAFSCWSWAEVMGNSVWAVEMPDGRRLPRINLEAQALMQRKQA